MGMLVLVASALAGIWILFLIYRGRLAKWRGERSTVRVLAQSGFDTLADVYLPTKYGMTQIDALARVGGAIIVIEVRSLPGSVVGAAREPSWILTRHGGRQRRRFPNPLIGNWDRVAAVEAIVGDMPVGSLVVFPDGTSFPKGLPEGITTIRELEKDLAEVKDRLPETPDSLAAWDRLRQTVGATDRRTAQAAYRDTVAWRRLEKAS